MKILIFICFSFFINLTAQTSPEGKKISPLLFGLFFEDINFAADGGLYAELVQNRSFEYNPNSRREWHPLAYWEYITPGFSYGSISLETNSPIHPNNPHYIILDIEHVGNEVQHTGDAGIGIANLGFNGMTIKKNEKYNLSFFARQISNEPINLLVGLQSPSGKTKYAENEISISSNGWKEYTSSFTVTEDSDSASLLILATTVGKLALDVISLFPEKTFKNRQNGLRADIAQMLAEMKPKFIRFPGGCLVHGDGLGNMYRWKNTVGPIEERVEQKNLWGYNQTAGLGYFEYFQFCEDIGAKPLPVLPAAVSCQNSGGTWRIGGTGQKAIPNDEIPEYIQEVLDLVEWANGSQNSKWGSKRAEAGHPEPFNLEYIGIGNEDKITPEFAERFTQIYNAVKEKHPEITIIGTSGPFHSGEDFEKGWRLAKELNVPIVDEHYYADPKWFISNQHRYDTYDRNTSKVYLGEYASWGNKLRNAIIEAVYMTSLERNGDVVVMASYAPLLAKKGFTQWETDLIFFDNTKICPTPNFYVQKMFMTNQGDYYYKNIIQRDEKDTLLAASCVKDSETGDIILKLVNAGTENQNMNINLAGFENLIYEAEITILSGNADAENTFENPINIVPVKSEYKIINNFEYETPAMSLTVIRIKTK